MNSKRFTKLYAYFLIFSISAALGGAEAEETDITTQQLLEKAQDYGISEQEIKQKTQEYTQPDTMPSIIPGKRKITEEVSPAPETVKSVLDKVGGGNEKLKPFGYDIFNLSKITFEPVQNIAIPPDYVVGPGDEIVITVWGETQLNYTLPVNRNGAIVIPNVGLIPVTGVSLKVLQEKLCQKMTSYYA